MGEVAVAVLKWTFRAAFIIAVAIGLGVFISVIVNSLIVGYNLSVLADIFALIQIWLPFNLNIVLLWLTVSASAFIVYKLAALSYVLLNTFVGKN